MKNMLNISTGMRKIGLTTAMTRADPIKFNVFCIEPNNDFGKYPSIDLQAKLIKDIKQL